MLNNGTGLSEKYPLHGIKVLELARVLAGPWAGQLLADLGAQVVKVEAPSGDETRYWGDQTSDTKLTAYFKSTNRGKQSFVADLTNSSDLEFVQTMSNKADIIIENFKVGSLKKFKLDYANIKRRNPKIIYCSITGFGQSGPYSFRPGYDFIIQAMGGIMDLTGDLDGEPQKPGVAYADIFTGLYSVVAIQSALINRRKSNKGTHIDMSLFDSQLAVLANQASTFLETGKIPKRMGNTHPVIVPYQKFETADGSIIIACGNDRQFAKLCKAMGWKLHESKAFSTNQARLLNREKLIPLMEKKLISKSKKSIIEKLGWVGVPCGTINTVKEALTDPQAHYRKMIRKIEGVEVIRTPILYNSLKLKYDHPAPALGQHTSEIKNKIKKNSFWRKK